MSPASSSLSVAVGPEISELRALDLISQFRVARFRAAPNVVPSIVERGGGEAAAGFVAYQRQRPYGMALFRFQDSAYQGGQLAADGNPQLFSGLGLRDLQVNLPEVRFLHPERVRGPLAGQVCKIHRVLHGTIGGLVGRRVDPLLVAAARSLTRCPDLHVISTIAGEPFILLQELGCLLVTR